MSIEPKFPYEKLNRTTHPSGFRTYTCPQTEKELASVTTILGLTGDNTGLENWKKFVGEKEAKRISSEAAGLGSIVHEHMENHFLGEPRPEGSNLIYKMAKEMSDVLIVEGFNYIDEIWGLEAPLYFPGLWAGTADLICTYKGKPTIGDFKTTRKMKKREHIENYFCQLAAYSIAHDELFDTQIEQAVILMVDRENNFQEFLIEGKEFHEFGDIWLKRVGEYYEQKEEMDAT